MGSRALAQDEKRGHSRKRLADVAFERLMQAIKSGAYGEGERLPTEHDLAGEFQVSRPVIREALKRLRDQGLIYSRQGAGSFVRQSGVKNPLGFGQIENIADLQRCYEFRITLEPEAAAAAAGKHSENSLEEIRAALELMRDATVRQRHREDADFQFHLAIARASENRYFFIAMEALKDHIAVGMQFHGLTLRSAPGGLTGVFEEHRGIYEAIANNEPDNARKRMRAHLIGSRERLFEGRRADLDQ